MRRAAAAVLFALLAAGCATTGSGSGAPPPTTSAPTTSAPTASAPTAGAPTTSPPGAASLTVDGVIEKGVEPGCLVLRAGPKSYLLQGAEATGAPVAVPVRVTGELLDNVASYCQQGTPFQVDSISRR